MINVDALALIKLFEAEIELLNKFKVDEAKLYTDGSTESEEEEEEIPQDEENIKNLIDWVNNKRKVMDYVQKMISTFLDLTLQEIDLVSSESKTKKSESIKTFQACKYCDQVFPYQIF